MNPEVLRMKIRAMKLKTVLSVSPADTWSDRDLWTMNAGQTGAHPPRPTAPPHRPDTAVGSEKLLQWNLFVSSPLGPSTSNTTSKVLTALSVFCSHRFGRQKTLHGEDKIVSTLTTDTNSDLWTQVLASLWRAEPQTCPPCQMFVFVLFFLSSLQLTF